MKQVTGATNNRPIHTAKTLLAPREAFSSESASGLSGGGSVAVGTELLRLAGMAPAADEEVVFSDREAPVVAVMAAGFGAAGAGDSSPETVQWTTPLLAGRPSGHPCIRIFRHGELVYIKVWGAESEKLKVKSAKSDDALRLAEVIVAPTPEDTLFYVVEFSRAMALDGYGIHVAGRAAKRDAKLLRRYFKRVSVCG